jgi:hypothetical protein
MILEAREGGQTKEDAAIPQHKPLRPVQVRCKARIKEKRKRSTSWKNYRASKIWLENSQKLNVC